MNTFLKSLISSKSCLCFPRQCCPDRPPSLFHSKLNQNRPRGLRRGRTWVHFNNEKLDEMLYIQRKVIRFKGMNKNKQSLGGTDTADGLSVIFKYSFKQKYLIYNTYFVQTSINCKVKMFSAHAVLQLHVTLNCKQTDSSPTIQWLLLYLLNYVSIGPLVNM